MPQPDFTDVMTGLIGPRLAVWDELATQGPATAEQLAAWLHPQHGITTIRESLAWLASNRLARVDDSNGRWQAIPVRLAEKVYLENGPIFGYATPRVPTPIEAGLQAVLAVPEPPKIRTHTHQAQFELCP